MISTTKLSAALFDAKEREFSGYTEDTKWIQSDKFKSKIEEIIRSNENEKKKSEKIRKIRNRILIIAAIVIISVSLLSMDSVRQPIWSFVTRTYEKFTAIFASTTDLSPTKSNDELNKYIPTYFPEGYERKEYWINDQIIKIRYTDSEDREIVWSVYDSSLSLTYDSEGAVVRRSSIDGRERIVCFKNGIVQLYEKYPHKTIQIVYSEEIPEEEIEKILKSAPILDGGP